MGPLRRVPSPGGLRPRRGIPVPSCATRWLQPSGRTPVRGAEVGIARAPLGGCGPRAVPRFGGPGTEHWLPQLGRPANSFAAGGLVPSRVGVRSATLGAAPVPSGRATKQKPTYLPILPTYLPAFLPTYQPTT